ncbi:P-loop containing nucleoside triphosphate hydrolase protein [Fimicolochytrium jonesii]|uniref:P-loop containing nucleoside triphosphate hydrolase protein n=1 Tax=Fimicolochytrium jonesii TaxID=1396493 RepID=UPI0022FEBCFF|nr:P-loop containing nucleoside triphosphate hydrolase protein [Fimicolochytrium jonesii]KAI8816005.1 P-loop containing nucleoside triphosphate hydrolase protein [Fimicolochytrium jonesii]
MADSHAPEMSEVGKVPSEAAINADLPTTETVQPIDVHPVEAPTITIHSEIPADSRAPTEDKNAKAATPTAAGGSKPTPPAAKPKISYFTLLTRYATPLDKGLMIFGALGAAGSGAILPLMTIVFGDLTQIFNNAAVHHLGYDYLMPQINEKALIFVYLGIAMFVGTYIYMSTWLFTGENISHRIREGYLQGVLRQNIAYFDNIGGGQVSTRIITDTQMVQDGISEKVPMLLMNVATFVAGFSVAFAHSWKLTLVLACCVPAIGITAAMMGKFIGRFTIAGLKSYASAGDVAEETFASIRTVTSFMAQDKMAKAYSRLLDAAEKFGVKKQIVMGIGWGAIQFVVFGTYALAFWYGSILLYDGEINLGSIMTCFFSVLIGAFALAGTSSEITAINFSIGAGTTLFEAIDRVPEIDCYSSEGFMPEPVRGHIKVEHVAFRYPSRPEVVVLHDMTADILPGTTCALVGSSGSGKSTIIQLLERFYNPESGTIYLDGVNIKDINVRWLRRQMGYVTQEPVLFKGTLWENVAHGLVGTSYETWTKEKKMEIIIEACKSANAHNFIMALPFKYETRIGERGLLLSGGQKQRIAIARAIVKNPPILLLDEATSALDTESEKLVQEALDRAAEGRTTIVIAHRLSTIRNANQIIVMDRGRIIEVGDHHSLVAKGESGFYAKLVEAQKISAKKEQEEAPAGGAAPPVDPDAIIIDPVVAETEEAAKSLRRGSLHRRESRKSAHSLDSTALGKRAESVGLPAAIADVETDRTTLDIFKRLLVLNRPEAFYMTIGVIGAIVNGVTQPIFAILFGRFIGVFALPDLNDMRSQANFWAAMFLVIGIANLIASFVKFAMFGISGEKLTTRLRDKSFRAMMRQNIAWFDIEEHSVGALTSNLSNDAQNVQNMSGQIAGNLIELAACIAGGAVVAVSTGWKLGLVVLATLPLMIAANKWRMDLIRKGNQATKVYYESSAQVACEAVGSMRTIAALTRENDVANTYHRDLETPLAIGHRNAFGNTAIYAMSQTITFLINALGFWYGGRLIATGEYAGQEGFKTFFTTFMAITFSSQAAGRVFSLMPDVGKAKDSAQYILNLFDRTPPIDSWSTEEKTHVDKEAVQGKVEFKDVHFVYPNRPSIKVLKGLNLTILPGQFVALVGPSGCGKSTTVGLMERFYDVDRGSVDVDGVPLTSLNIHTLRSFVSLVGQEPNLYDMTIRENIVYGLPAETIAGLSEDVIIKAAKDANIHEFITGLPDGYNTSLGGKGAQLSGGQKQRIAIARALIRQPKILLLDEATSALDATSEKVVQEALDKAAKGRTTIAIAHRLSSIKSADAIYVFKDGVVAESGTHAELIEQRGLYYQMVIQQDLGEE